jgi:xylonate dehydratase
MSESKSDQPKPTADTIFGSDEPDIYSVVTKQPGPVGLLPLTAADLLERPSGDIFGWSQDVGMGWEPSRLGRAEVLILSTQGGIRLPDGRPLALGYHTGHWEVGLLMQAAAGRKGLRGCSTASLIATTRRLCFAG